MTKKSLLSILLVTLALAFFQGEAGLRASGLADTRGTFEELRETGMTQAEEIRENSDVEEIEENIETSVEEVSENRGVSRRETTTVYWSLLRQRARGVEFKEKQEIVPYDDASLAELNHELVGRIDALLASRNQNAKLRSALSNAKRDIESFSASREAAGRADVKVLRQHLDAVISQKRSAKGGDQETFDVLHESYVELLRLHHLAKS